MKTVTWNQLSKAEQRHALARPAQAADVSRRDATASILATVRERGDEALIDFTREFDGITPTSLIATEEEFEAGISAVPAEVLNAIDDARSRIEKFHLASKPRTVTVETAPGVVCRREPRAISPVGLYVPAGSAPLPSTVLMLGVPARLAGCEDIWISTPPNAEGRADPCVLAAAASCGIRQVLKAGGAQAIGALAYGTDSVEKCLKIFGPGNAWVTEAKQQVSADVNGAAIDMPAGPSEVMVVADASSDPAFVASDLLSQCEHGPDSHAVLVTDSSALAARVETEITRQLGSLSRAEIIRRSLEKALFVITDDMSEALEVANEYAAEHLILQMKDAADWVPRVARAGSVFVGPWSPEAVGDYCSGTNHVLPTYGFARAYSGVSCASFVTQMTVQELSQEGIRGIGDNARVLARAEGLDAHESAVSVRLEAIAQP